MMSSAAKLLANVSAPIAALFAIGYIVQVVNLWVVARQHYSFGFITAWHVASVIDRTVIIGIGLKYLVFFWFAAILIMFLATFLRRRYPDNLLERFRRYVAATPEEAPAPTSWTFFHGGPAPVFVHREEPPARKEDKADSSNWWLGSVLLAAALALAWLLI